MMNDTASKFQAELNPSEKILWSGQPQQGVVLRASDWFIIPFTVMWGGFTLFFAYMAATEGAPLVVMVMSFERFRGFECFLFR